MTRRWCWLAALAAAAILFMHESAADAGKLAPMGRAPVVRRVGRAAAALAVAALCVGCAVQNRTIYTQQPGGAAVVVEEHQVFLGTMMNWAVRGGFIEARPVYTPQDYGRVSRLYRQHLEARRYELSHRRWLSRGERMELADLNHQLGRLGGVEVYWFGR